MAYRLPLYNKNFPLILFWSQKSGCTIFVKWFFFQLGLLDRALQYNPWVHYYREQIYEQQKNYKENLVEEILLSRKDTIKLVRNPYYRAISSFIALSRNVLLRNKRQQEWKKIKKCLYNCKRYNDEKLLENISFKQFLYYLKKNGAKIGLVDGHRAQQYINNEETYVSNYIHLENFNSYIHEIEGKYELLDSPETILTSKHHQAHKMRKQGHYAEKIITEEIFSKNFLPTYDSFYDRETTELVNEIFKKDFEVYGYEKK